MSDLSHRFAQYQIEDQRLRMTSFLAIADRARQPKPADPRHPIARDPHEEDVHGRAYRVNSRPGIHALCYISDP